MVYLENTAGTRFWSCQVVGKSVKTQYGLVGCDGRTTTKDFDTKKDAKEYLDAQVATKRQGDYQDATKSKRKPNNSNNNKKSTAKTSTAVAATATPATNKRQQPKRKATATSAPAPVKRTRRTTNNNNATKTTTAVPKVTTTPKVTPVAVPSTATATKNNTKKVGAVDKAVSFWLRSGTVIEDVMLNQTNLCHNNNKFYKLQVIQTPSGFTLFTKWGRVGEDGKTQEKGPYDKSTAMSEFAKKFYSKTLNDWSKYRRNKDSFVVYGGKYTVLEMEHDPDAAAEQQAILPLSVSSGLPIASCQLDSSTKGLVDLIFNEDMFKSAMSDMNLDPKKLPLGALSQSQIAKGFTVLESIQNTINSGRATNRRLMELTSEFYTLIPHAFGRQRGPILNTAESVQQKFDMLNTLTDIEAAQAMQKNRPANNDADDESRKTQPHPSDVKYGQLASDLTLLNPKQDDDCKLIETYFNNTKQNGGYRGNMKLNKVWKVNRHNEEERFAEHDDVAFRKLLWHGTNVAVVAAILKSGLRIMPHSGGRVGRGIYLADQHQKSAWYTRSAQGTTIMFLVEAALGDSHEIQQDDSSLVKAPTGYQSVLARGRTEPASSKSMQIDGKTVVVPQGKPKSVSPAQGSSFHHNEFLIYKESQHRIRYILTFRDS